jgi:hypothetical protein
MRHFWSNLLLQMSCITMLCFSGSLAFAQLPPPNSNTEPQAVNINPVIIPNADAACFKYNGKYYHTIFRSGDFTESADMVRWSAPRQVFEHNNEWTDVTPRTRMAGTDMRYINGVFHYNYRIMPTADMGHAVSRIGPMGPYHDAVTDVPFRIAGLGPHLYKDDDGRCYYYTTHISRYKNEGRDYTLAGQGNEIWGQTMADPWTLTGEDQYMLRTSPNTFEEVDSHVMENPWVIKYRGQYYMFYNLCHTGFGNYSMSVAQADGPMEFDDSKKYLDPLIERTLYGAHPGDGQSILHPGQPSVLRGPNGFTWWMTYFAQYPQSRKSTAVDRVFFMDRQAYMDGPNNPTTEGYHPPPALPTTLDVFDDDYHVLASHWEENSGDWQVSDGVYRQSKNSGMARNMLQSEPARHYLFEANVRMPDTGHTGALAWYHNADNYLACLVDADKGEWVVREVVNGKAQEQRAALRDDFVFDAFHQIRIERNGKYITLWLDEEIVDPALHHFTSNFTGLSLPGLMTEKTAADFDGVLYTIGWDEHDANIAGWGAAASGEPQSGQWSVKNDGMSLTDGAVFKGELLREYEFSTHIMPEPETEGSVGIYPVYIDRENYLRAEIAPERGHLRVTGKHNGHPVNPQRTTLPNRWPLQVSGVENKQWRVTIRNPGYGWERADYEDEAWQAGGDIRQTDEFWMRGEFTMDRIPPGLLRFWMANRGTVEISVNGIPALTVTEDFSDFRSHEMTDAARLSVTTGRNVLAVHWKKSGDSRKLDMGLFVPKIPDLKGGHHIRAVKRSDKVILVVDGQQILTVPGHWPASQVGLVSENTSAVFNGMTHFRLGAQYGGAEEPLAMGDNFDDNLLASQWVRKPVSRSYAWLNTSAAWAGDTAPDIRFREMNQRLQIQGAECGFSNAGAARWSGSGLFYAKPMTGSATVAFDFNGLAIRGNNPEMQGGALGLRLWKADNNWIEILKVHTDRGEMLELSVMDSRMGRILGASTPLAGDSGRLSLTVDRASGEITAFCDGTEYWSRTIPGFTTGTYYAAITAYTVGWDPEQPAEIAANVDHFTIKGME